MAAIVESVLWKGMRTGKATPVCLWILVRIAPRCSEFPPMSIKRESRRTPLTPITSSKMLVTIASVSMCGYHLLSFLCHANSKNGCERLTVRLARRQFRKIVENCQITRHHITRQLVQKSGTNPKDLLLRVERPRFAAEQQILRI